MLNLIFLILGLALVLAAGQGIADLVRGAILDLEVVQGVVLGPGHLIKEVAVTLTTVTNVLGPGQDHVADQMSKKMVILGEKIK